MAPGEIFVADPQVTLLGLLAIQLLHLGFVEQARARLQQAHARARLLGRPMARLVAIWFDALFEVRLGDAERVAALADEMHALVDEFAVAQGRNACRWFRGWADARMGSRATAIAAFERHTKKIPGSGCWREEVRSSGMPRRPWCLQATGKARNTNSRTRCKSANTLGERVYLPQLFLIQAAIARARGEPGVADAAIRRAIAEARAQEAPWLELMALLELCERGGATAKDRRALAALVDRLPEALDTAASRRREHCSTRRSPSSHACFCSILSGCQLATPRGETRSSRSHSQDRHDSS